MTNFLKVMSRKENYKLYNELENQGLFDKVTLDNYKNFL